MIKSRNGLFLCLGLGLLGMAGTFVAIGADPAHALHSYLVAFVFWIGLAWGSLGWLASFHAGRSRWVVLLRRAFEVNAATLPVFALLSLPLFLNASKLYEWYDNPRAGAGDPELLGFRAAYMSHDFFFGRAAGYFLFWSLISVALYRWSKLQDQRPTEHIYTVRQRFWSAAALPALALTIAHASIDWIMSLRPGWVSTMFGLYVIAGAIIGSIALFTIQSAWLQDSGKLPGPLPPAAQHNIGKLLFAFTIFWAYIGFGQFVLMWMANMPEEIPWMLSRTTTGWEPLAWALLVGHFVLPFSLLLPVAFKMKRKTLAWIGGWILIWCYVDVYWLIMPHLFPNEPNPSWMDLTAFLGVGGIAGATWFFIASRTAPAPLGDQYIHESMQASHG